MNVFVLCTGRCGSMSLSRACQHITNFSSAHESLASRIGAARFSYPENHIEIDNRLSWYLGRLDQIYGNDAFYVHMTRDPEQVYRSFAKRKGFGIMKAFEFGLIHTPSPDLDDAYLLAKEICDTANANIEHFLKDKTRKMQLKLENGEQDFKEFWNRIGAKGDVNAATECFSMPSNTSKDFKEKQTSRRLAKKISRIIRSPQK